VIISASYSILRNLAGIALLVWSLTAVACGADEAGSARHTDVLAGIFGPSAPDLPENCAELLEHVAVGLDGLRASEAGPQRGISLQYRPAILSACLASSQETSLGNPGLVAAAIGLGTADAYVLRLPRNGLANGHPIDEAFLEYMQVRSAADFVELVNGDSVVCSFVHVESAPSIGPHHTVLLAFDHAQDGGDRKIFWKDREGRLGGDMVFGYEQGVFERYEALISGSVAATLAKQ